MANNSTDSHHRRSIRLRGYDYAQAGAYFVTVCARNRECLFGNIADGEIRFNEAGGIIAATWPALPQRFPQVGLNAFIIMPNHIHGVLRIVSVGAQFIAPHHADQGAMNQGVMNQGAMNQGAMNQGAMNRAPTLGGGRY